MAVDGLLHDNTKPLPEAMLIGYQWGLIEFTWGQFHKKGWRYLSLVVVWKLSIQDNKIVSQGPMR